MTGIRVWTSTGSFSPLLGAGLRPSWPDEATIVVRMGGTKLSKEELLDGLRAGIATAMCGRIESLHRGITSSIRPRETSAFRPASSKLNVEHDFVFRVQ